MTRELSLGKNAQERAEEAVFSVLGEDTTGDPEILESEIRTAFSIELSLILSPEEAEAEYGAFGLTKEKDGFWLYQNETVRTFEDRILGFYQSREEGNVDISVQRDRFGKVTSLTVWRAGDQEYDERTRKLEQYKMRSYGMETEVGTEEK